MSGLTLRQRGRKWIDFYNDRRYYRQLFLFAFPIALQNLIMSSLNMVGVLMIGQLGETAIAAVGLAGQVFFLLQLLLFGIVSGSAIFTAQLWGKRDVPNIRRVLSLSLLMGLAGGLTFMAIARLAPEVVLGFYTKDEAVIALGSEYLRTFSLGYVFFAITAAFATVLRSIGDVRTPLFVSISALGLSTLLSYGLIFGNFGLPELGVQGAAVAALVARTLECLALLTIIYLRKSPLALGMREILHQDWAFARKVFRQVLPVTLNEVLWAFGITTYNAIYAHIGTESIAAMNIVATIDNLAIVVFIGIANACAILVGNRIGANDEGEAFRYAGRSLSLGVLGGLLMGGLVLVTSGFLLGLYKVSPAVIDYAQKILLIVALFLWLRVANLILFVGIFRSGGDTRFAFFLDAGSIWLVGVPLALLGAFVFHLPIYWVYLLVMMDELAKWGIGTWRFLSKRWIHNVTQLAPPADLTPAAELAAPVELAPPVELAQAAELPAGTGLTLPDS